MDIELLNQVKESNKVVLEQTMLLIEASSQISDVLKNTYELLVDLAKLADKGAVEKKQLLEEQNEVQLFSRQQIEYVENVHLEVAALLESMNSFDYQLKANQDKLSFVEGQLEESTKLLSSQEAKQTEMEKECSVQATYTAVMGATLGKMLWKTSKTENIINTFIKEETVPAFLELSDITIDSFIDSFRDELPATETYEFKLAMSIIGININISAQRSGREVILSEPVGVTFINHILDHLDVIQMPTGLLLKRLFLVLLYNISICKNGAKLIDTNVNGVRNILQCLSSAHSTEMQMIALTLINSLLHEIPSREFHVKVKETTTKEDLERLMKSNEPNLKELSTKFEKNFYGTQSA